MNRHAFNLYPVLNQGSLSISYRLVDVEGEIGLGSDDPDLAVKNLNILTRKIAFGQKLPVTIIHGGEMPLLAIAADRPIERRDYQLTPHVVTLRPRDEVHRVNFQDLDSSTLGIALSFLGWELRGHLYGRSDLWQNSPNTFFSKRPVNANDQRRRMDVYGGFSPRFVMVQGTLHLSVPVIYCYADSRWADDAFDDREIQRLGGRKMLYHYGSQMFPIKFQRRTGKSIHDQEFIAEGSSKVAHVFDWTREKVGPRPGGRPLNPSSPAIRYKNLGNDQERFGALSLCKLMLTNDDPRVAASRRDHQRMPDDRIEASSRVVERYFAKLTLSGCALKLGTAPRTNHPKRFCYPAIQLGKGKVLRVDENHHRGDVPLKELAAVRARLIEDQNVGFAVVSEMDDQILLLPRSLNDSLAKDLKARIETLVSRLRRVPYKLRLVRYHDQNKHTLRAQVSSVRQALEENEVNGGRGIMVLPFRAQSDLHNYLKRALREQIQFQCMSAEKIVGFYRTNGANISFVPSQLESRYRSYLFNAVMGLMIVNRQWPWVLHEGTHYDCYIGLDVLNHTAAMTFCYEGGRVCAMRDQVSRDKERLSRGVVAKLVYDGLVQDLPDLDELPKSIVLRRDGRLFESEWLGFKDAIQRLIDEELLPKDVCLGAVEIPKHHSYGVRLVETSPNGFRNPPVGCWEYLSGTEGIVCTTGWPFNIPGTVEPLFVRVARGDLDIAFVLEDTFDMSQLCWPMPRGCMRLPIDLKLCDEHLRAFAASANEDSAVFGETLENEEEVLVNANGT